MERLRKTAITAANKKSKVDNIKYSIGDIRYDIPRMVNGMYVTNIVWDAGMAYFTPTEIDGIVQTIYYVLKERNGILSGQTIAVREGKLQSRTHKYEFENKRDVQRFLKQYFKNVLVFETIYEDRTNFYFFASDGVIPFSDRWEHQCKFGED